MHKCHWVILFLGGLTSEESSLIFDIIVYMGYYMLPLTLILVGAIHHNIYLLSPVQVKNQYFIET